jgi:Mn2+/Fe2+ NRAMP family transporter
MRFGNSFKNDDFEDIRRYEEYQRRKDEAIVKGVGNFLYRYFIYTFIYLATYIILAMGLSEIFKVSFTLSVFISIVLSFFVFKIKYVKEYPFKSLITLGFIYALEFIVFGTN